jgi:hypothetical protein
VKVIQIPISDAEYLDIMRRTEDGKFSTESDFIKAVLFPESMWSVSYSKMLKRLETAPLNFPFTLSSLMRDAGWSKMDKGTRLALGRSLAKLAANNRADIVIVQKSGAGAQYMRVSREAL